MVYGIGIDIQSALALEALPGNDVFFTNTFTPEERKAAARRGRPGEYYAKRFAAKEAVIKAFHTNTNRVRLDEVETLNDETGAPFIRLHGGLCELARKKGIAAIHISLSFDSGMAVAYALLWAAA